jgi:chemotaxis family two-component system sensor kinase Cph1
LSADKVYSIKSGEVTLTNCDREPIHIPGCVLPHGVLMVLNRSDLSVVQVSVNSEKLFRHAPDRLMERGLSLLLDSQQLGFLDHFLQTERLDQGPLYVLTARPPGINQAFDITAHTQGPLAILEWEPASRTSTPTSLNYYYLVKKAVNRLQNAPSLRGYCEAVTEEVRTLTGIDRVMVYRFQEDGSGWVFAESKREDLVTYLNLHYPAADIPRPARELFTKLWHRLVPDVRAEPAELYPLLNRVTNRPLDMTYCALRGASVMYTEYLQNMGVSAALVLPLMKEGQLWGLIATHHYSTCFLPHDIRVACEFLAQVVSLQLAAAEDREQQEYRLRIRSAHESLVTRAAVVDTPLQTITEGSPSLLDLIEATGVALVQNGVVSVAGRTPSTEQILGIADWAREREGDIQTNTLSREYPAADLFKDVACGLIAVPISRGRRDFLMWFRPEKIETVSWAGYPYDKPVEIGPHGPRLTPRKSFELWQESVEGTARPWSEVEIEAARRFRIALLDVVIGHSEQLAKLNKELEATVEELDAFAYVASHDLKEPLRGIHNYAAFLIEDYQDKLGSDGEMKLKAMMRLSQRMESLIESLLHYSRMGRGEIVLREKDLNLLLKDVLDNLSSRIQEEGVHIQIPQTLPVLPCDPVMIGEVFTNLISNALKYNDKPLKEVEIGYDWQAEPDEQGGTKQAMVFHVRDNGIGIPERHRDVIFRIFKRLHARDKFGGGTGAGLTIVKKIVERHGGRIWLDSREGEGTTFFFTLSH